MAPRVKSSPALTELVIGPATSGRGPLVRALSPARRRGRISPPLCKLSRQKFAAVAQAFIVDTVSDAGGEVPLGGDFKCGEPLRRLKQSLRGNEIVAIAVNEQDRRPRGD